MFVAVMAFHAKISDPTIGGTYMTLLNTVSNLAGQWSSTMVLWFVDPFSYYSDCEGTSDATLGCYNAPQREVSVCAFSTCLLCSESIPLDLKSISYSANELGTSINVFYSHCLLVRVRSGLTSPVSEIDAQIFVCY